MESSQYGPRQDTIRTKSPCSESPTQPASQIFYPPDMIPPQVAIALGFIGQASHILTPESHPLFCDEGYREFEIVHPDLHPAHEYAFRQACAAVAHFFRSYVPIDAQVSIQEAQREMIAELTERSDKLSEEMDEPI